MRFFSGSCGSDAVCGDRGWFVALVVVSAFAVVGFLVLTTGEDSSGMLSVTLVGPCTVCFLCPPQISLATVFLSNSAAGEEFILENRVRLKSGWRSADVVFVFVRGQRRSGGCRHLRHPVHDNCWEVWLQIIAPAHCFLGHRNSFRFSLVLSWAKVVFFSRMASQSGTLCRSLCPLFHNLVHHAGPGATQNASGFSFSEKAFFGTEDICTAVCGCGRHESVVLGWISSLFVAALAEIGSFCDMSARPFPSASGGCADPVEKKGGREASLEQGHSPRPHQRGPRR